MTVTAAVQDGNSNTGASSITTASKTLSANKLNVIAVTSRRNSIGADNVPTISGWTKVGTEVTLATNRTLLTWFQKQVGSNTTSTYTIDFAAQAQDYIAYEWVELDIVDATTPVVQSAGANDGGANGTTFATPPTLAAFGSINNATLAAFSHSANAAMTPEAGWTKVGETGVTGTASATVMIAFKASNDTTAQASWAANVGHAGLAMEIKAAAGTAFTQSLGGTLTSAGGLAKSTSKPLAGTLTSAGGLAKAVTKKVAGTLTTAGALAKAVSKPLAGTLTTAGAVTNLRVFFQSLGGTLTTAGSLTKAVSKPLGGTLTTAGALAKLTTKPLAGALTTAGALARLCAKPLGGTLAISGALAKAVSQKLAGTLTTSGALTKLVSKALAGTLTTAGAIANVLGAAPGLTRVGGFPERIADAIDRIASRVLDRFERSDHEALSRAPDHIPDHEPDRF